MVADLLTLPRSGGSAVSAGIPNWRDAGGRGREAEREEGGAGWVRYGAVVYLFDGIQSGGVVWRRRRSGSRVNENDWKDDAREALATGTVTRHGIHGRNSGERRGNFLGLRSSAGKLTLTGQLSRAWRRGSVRQSLTVCWRVSGITFDMERQRGEWHQVTDDEWKPEGTRYVHIQMASNSWGIPRCLWCLCVWCLLSFGDRLSLAQSREASVGVV
ncbi:hypothetical protein QBC40DRAFT_301537 [Triangularia verruculosa]|uniref:Uncharacterized protein n=1 Tax=Triangularia verruculosa TaxID=2587418 RepID=A0AAN6X6N8_9PEZI|nr:hypothetical protein QBC40DRAFT_301537 [Triangularia verruculosa]